MLGALFARSDTHVRGFLLATRVPLASGECGDFTFTCLSEHLREGKLEMECYDKEEIF